MKKVRPVFTIADSSSVVEVPISPEKQALLDKLRGLKEDAECLEDFGFIKPKTPLKPIKNKSLKRIIIGDAIQFEKWSPMVKDWCDKYDYAIEIHDDVDRIDIKSKIEAVDWRIVVEGVYGGEFSVTIFYDNTIEAWNQKRVDIQYIKQHDVIEALDLCITIRHQFKEI